MKRPCELSAVGETNAAQWDIQTASLESTFKRDNAMSQETYSTLKCGVTYMQPQLRRDYVWQFPNRTGARFHTEVRVV